MRWTHWALAASLLFNGLALTGYFYWRQLDGEERVVRALALTPMQLDELRALRREARVQLVESRRGLSAEVADLARAIREARPGDDRIEPALRKLADARIPSQIKLARRLVEFREQLDPAQQQAFNRMLGKRGFAVRLLGFLPRPAEAGRPAFRKF
jgi:hypothetical protein